MMTSSLLHIQVGSAPIATGDPTPTLIIEAESERLEALRQSQECAENVAEQLFHQAVLAASAQQELVWYRFSDDRFNGLVPLERWREFFPNLELLQEETIPSQTLGALLAQWPPAQNPEQRFSLTLSQGDPVAVLKGAKEWLPRIQRIELRGPKAEHLWRESLEHWLADQGFQRDLESTLTWFLDERAMQLMRQRAEIEALKEQLLAIPSLQAKESEEGSRQGALAFEALREVFPYAAYRKNHPDLTTLSDEDLLTHYLQYGRDESVDLETLSVISEGENSDPQRGKHSPLRQQELGKVLSQPLIFQDDAEEASLILSPLDEIEIGAWLVGNKLYLSVSEERSKSLVPAIYKGRQGYGLKHIEWSNEILDQLALSRVYHLLSQQNRPHLKILDQSAGGLVLDAGINQLSNFFIPGGETLHVHLSDIQPGATLPLVEDFRITSPGGETWVFEVLLALHRAKGRLEIIANHHTATKSYFLEFQTDKKGGTLRSGYHRATLNLPLDEGITSLVIHLRDIEFVSEADSRLDSYYFIANPILRYCGPSVQERDFKLQPRALRDDQECRTSDRLFSAVVSSFSSPEDPSLILSAGNGKCYALFSPLAAKVRLKADHSHTLVIHAQPSGDFSLFVNGTFCERITISADATPVPLPLHWLRGEPVQVEIRDVSGSQVFLSHSLLAPRFLTPENVILSESRSPFPTNLTVRANHRYQSLRQHLREPIEGVSTEMLVRAVETLDRNYDTLELAPLVFPVVSDPEASVIIPAHDKVQATYYCLSSLLLAHNRVRFEIILVDDGSTDETGEIEKWVSGIRVIRNDQPLRFIKACNRGVREAKGKFVVLLNNDTEVTVGWLDALVDAFQRFENVGAAGAKLLYPDGRLQDAGGIIWGSGNPWNYGNGMNPWDPRFCYTRQVDYLSGAALITTKEIWDEVGGLSQYLEPMYFEDTDFAFKVREAGYKTYFVPSSVVYHFEGTTSGTDPSSGFKKFQEVNRPKFKRCWAKAFGRHGEEGVEPDLEKDRGITGRVLFIDYSTPRDDRDAGSYAAIREIKLVQSLGYKVTFLPQNLDYLADYTDELLQDGVEVITAPFYLSLAGFLMKRATEFDAAYITRYNVARETVGLIREHSPKTRILLNNADLHFLRELRTALVNNDEERMELMRIVREQELDIMRRVDLVLSYNEVEHTVITSHTDGDVKVMTCPWVVDLPDHIAPLSERKGISFIGNFDHRPNVEAVHWFCRDVMPLLEEQNLTLTIYGSNMGPDIRDLASEWIHPVGHIKSVAEAYQKHRVFVAPLLSGAGIKGKVVSALAYGLPSVLTSIAAEGIGLRHGFDCFLAKKPEEWQSAINLLCTDDDLWVQMSKASRSYAATQFSFAAGKEKMKAAFEAVDLYRAIDG